MSDMRNMTTGPMTWQMGVFCLLVLVVMVLAIAALVKYLFFGRKP